MKKRWRVIVSAALAGTMALSMTACGGGNEDLVSEKSETAEKGESSGGEKEKLVFLRAGNEDYKKEAFSIMIENFEKEHPEYEVEYQEAPWGDDFETKLNTGFASGTAPDVIHYSLASIGARVPMGQYECLDEYVTDWEGMDDLYDSAIEAGSIGGKMYGVPYTPDARMFVINTELFEKAGLDPNNPPSNWEEFKEAHEKLVVKDDSGNVIQCGAGFPTSGTNINQWLEIFGIQNGIANLVDEATDEILFNTPEAVEALEYLKELKDIGMIEWDNTQRDQNPFYNGTAAMAVISENEFNSINTGDLEGKIKMVPMFGNKNAGTFCGMHFMFMNSDSKHKEGAWELIQYMCSKESMQVWMDTAKTAPVRSSMEDAYLEKNPVNGPSILEAISIGKGSPKVPYFNSVFTYVDDAMEQVYYGQATPQEALDAAAEKVQEEIDNQ